MFSNLWHAGSKLQRHYPQRVLPVQVRAREGASPPSSWGEGLAFEFKRIWIANHFQTPTPRARRLLQIEKHNRCQSRIRQGFPAARGRLFRRCSGCALPPLASIRLQLAALPATGQVVKWYKSPLKRGFSHLMVHGDVSSIFSHHSPPWSKTLALIAVHRWIKNKSGDLFCAMEKCEECMETEYKRIRIVW